MKIVIIGPAYPTRGGNALFIAHLYEALSTHHRVHVLSFSRLYPAFLFPGVRQHDISGVAVKRHPATPVIDCMNPFTWWKAARIAASFTPDLVLFSWWNPFFGILIHTVIKSLRRRSPSTVVAAIAENVSSHEQRRVDLIFTRHALNTADAFLVLSEAVGRNIRALFPSKPVFRSSLPIYDCYRIGEPLTREAALRNLNIQSRHVVLFFGYVRRYKGLMTLIEAFPRVRERIPDAHLLIVGEFYDDPAPYNAAIDRLRLRNGVTVIPRFVANEEVHLFYTAANLVVLPYLEATQSGILSIAIAFAKPAIVTRVGGLTEPVEDGRTGFIVQPADSQALAGSIIRFFEENLEQPFSSAVAEKSRENSFANIQAVVEKIYRRIASERSASAAGTREPAANR